MIFKSTEDKPGGLLESFDEIDAASSSLQATGEELFYQGHAVSAKGIKTFSVAKNIFSSSKFQVIRRPTW